MSAGSLATHEDLVAQVDALWANGPPDRGVVRAIEHDGVVYFRVRALSLLCEGCGFSVPQSRSRVAPEARRLWLLHHARCTEPKPRA